MVGDNGWLMKVNEGCVNEWIFQELVGRFE